MNDIIQLINSKGKAIPYRELELTSNIETKFSGFNLRYTEFMRDKDDNIMTTLNKNGKKKVLTRSVEMPFDFFNIIIEKNKIKRIELL